MNYRNASDGDKAKIPVWSICHIANVA